MKSNEVASSYWPSFEVGMSIYRVLTCLHQLNKKSSNCDINWWKKPSANDVFSFSSYSAMGVQTLQDFSSVICWNCLYQDLAEKVRDTLPDCSFDPMIRMLRKFLGFMNLTVSIFKELPFLLQ